VRFWKFYGEEIVMAPRARKSAEAPKGDVVDEFTDTGHRKVSVTVASNEVCVSVAEGYAELNAEQASRLVGALSEALTKVK